MKINIKIKYPIFNLMKLEIYKLAKKKYLFLNFNIKIVIEKIKNKFIQWKEKYYIQKIH